MILHLNPAAGVSGDMLLGALVDLGAPVERIEAAVAATGLTGWGLRVSREPRAGLLGTRVEVRTDDDAPARSADRLLDLAGRARPAPVARLASEALAALATVEATLHGVDDPGAVHLHELGGVDTVVDVVGTAAALHLLDIEEVVSAPVALGSGTVTTAHGVLPAPAPATLALLRGAAVRGIGTDTETVTPTGAALLRAMPARYGPMPAMTVRATGYGAGSRDPADRPNLLQATLGDRLGAGTVESGLVTLETNVDDVTGEELGHLLGAALAAGAVDAWASPVVMKKGRPAHTLHVLCRTTDVPVLEDLVLAHTGSLGVRRWQVQRRALPRFATIEELEGHRIRVKHGPWRSKPEHDDVARAAEALGVPPRTVAETVLGRLPRRPGPERTSNDGGDRA